MAVDRELYCICGIGRKIIKISKNVIKKTMENNQKTTISLVFLRCEPIRPVGLRAYTAGRRAYTAGRTGCIGSLVSELTLRAYTAGCPRTHLASIPTASQNQEYREFSMDLQKKRAYTAGVAV